MCINSKTALVLEKYEITYVVITSKFWQGINFSSKGYKMTMFML
jgi:hypothetical protein